MFCGHCGAPILGLSRFCDGCGAPIPAAASASDGPAPDASLLRRVMNIVLRPRAEWLRVAAEIASPRALYLGYVAPLAAIGVVASFVGRTVVASPAEPLAPALAHAVLTYALSFLGVFLVALIVDALAPSFGGRRDGSAALKLTVYGFTPGWIAGAFNAVPGLRVLALVGVLYAVYLTYLGLPVLMRCPAAKAAGYAVVTVLCAIATWALVAALAMGGTAGFGRMVLDVAPRSGV